MSEDRRRRTWEERGDVAMPFHIGSHPLATPMASPGLQPTPLGDSIQIPMQCQDPPTHSVPHPQEAPRVTSDNMPEMVCPHRQQALALSG